MRGYLKPWTVLQYYHVRAAVVAGSVFLNSALHYPALHRHPFYHELFSRVYLLPIFLGASWVGIRGGLWVSGAVTLVYSPDPVWNWHRDTILFYDRALEVALFNRDTLRQNVRGQGKKRFRVIEEFKALAELGEAASTLAHEMKNVVISLWGFARRIRGVTTMDGDAARYSEIVKRQAAKLEEMA
jgi:signal transduction histidine kinase